VYVLVNVQMQVLSFQKIVRKNILQECCFITHYFHSSVKINIMAYHANFGIYILFANVHTTYISTSFASWELLTSTGSCFTEWHAWVNDSYFLHSYNFMRWECSKTRWSLHHCFSSPWCKVKNNSQVTAMITVTLICLVCTLLCHTTAKHNKNYSKLLTELTAPVRIAHIVLTQPTACRYSVM
jgi:hypothetical protein